MNYQNGQFAPDDDPGGKPIPDHLATWWDGLQDEHRATFRGPRWAGPDVNHRLKVSLAVAKAMHDGLSVDDAVGLCLFPDGLGSWPFHTAWSAICGKSGPPSWWSTGPRRPRRPSS
jgi:hypothetical protein